MKKTNYINLAAVIFISIFFSYVFQLSPLLSILALLAIFTSAAILKNDIAPFYILLFLVPIDRFYFPFPYKLKLYQVALVVICLVQYVKRLSLDHKKTSYEFNALDLSVILLYLGRIYSFFISIDTAVTLKASILYGLFLLLYFYIRFQYRLTEPHRVIQYFVYISIIFIVFGFMEFLLGKLGLVNLRVSENIYVYGGRPWSVFREPDWFGGYLTFIIALTLPFVNYKPNNDKKSFIFKMIFWMALFMSLVIVVRSSWLGLAVGTFVVLILIKRTRHILIPTLVRLGIVIFVTLIFLFYASPEHFDSIRDRLVSIFSQIGHNKIDPATQVRLNSYAIIQSYIAEHPFKGYGAGAWEFLSQYHMHINPSLSANNILLTPIFEMGLIGVVLYLFFIYALITLGYTVSRYARTDDEIRYGCGIVIAIIGSFIVAIFNDIMLTGFYWAFLAIFNNYTVCLRNKNTK